ncbi:LysR family transcriptional regulator [Sinomonas atrocyanea]
MVESEPRSGFDAARLEVLLAVGTSGSLTGAARELNFSVSAISQQIARLSREAGTDLVFRTPKGVKLTEAGAVMLEHARRIRADTYLTRARLRALQSPDSGRVRVGCAASFTATALPRIIRGLRDERPRIEFAVRSATTDRILLMLADFDVDLAVVWHYSDDELPGAEDLATVPLLDDELRVALPEGHPLAAQPTVAAEDLLAEVLIVRQHLRLGPRLHEATGVSSSSLRILESNDYYEAQGLAAAGLGVAVLPELVAAEHRPGLAIRSLESPILPARRFLLAWPRFVDLSPAVAAFKDSVLAYARTHFPPTSTGDPTDS